MHKNFLFLIAFFIAPFVCSAQSFPPQAGFEGSTAIHKDSSVFVSWAVSCVVTRGPIRVPGVPEYPDSLANFGVDEYGVGPAGPDLTYHVVSLGDGGSALLTFDRPIKNGTGPDFAVFENGFMSGGTPYDLEAAFLELAFVEVSSDGEHFVRFPAVNEYSSETQLGGFAVMNARYLHNLAGKYIAGYGTPFDLDDLIGAPNINLDSITHVRIVDVIGNIDPLYATYDSHGNPVNDPWPTPFWQSGYDLGGVGVIHERTDLPSSNPPTGNPNPPNTTTSISEIYGDIKVYPNPAHEFLTIQTQHAEFFILRDVVGKVMLSGELNAGQTRLSLEHLTAGIYFLHLSKGQAMKVEIF